MEINCLLQNYNTTLGANVCRNPPSTHIHTVRHTFGVSCILLITNTRFIGLSNFLARTQTMVVGGFSTANSGKTQKTSFPIPSSVCVCVRLCGKTCRLTLRPVQSLGKPQKQFSSTPPVSGLLLSSPPFPSDLQKRRCVWCCSVWFYYCIFIFYTNLCFPCSPETPALNCDYR